MTAVCSYPRHRPQEYTPLPTRLFQHSIHPHRQASAPSTNLNPSQSTPPPPTTKMHPSHILTLLALSSTALSKSRTCHGQRLYCGSSLSNMGTPTLPPPPSFPTPTPATSDTDTPARLDHRRNLGRSPKGPARLPQLADGQALRDDLVRVRRPTRGGCAVVPERVCRRGVS